MAYVEKNGWILEARSLNSVNTLLRCEDPEGRVHYTYADRNPGETVQEALNRWTESLASWLCEIDSQINQEKAKAEWVDIIQKEEATNAIISEYISYIEAARRPKE